MSMMAGTELLDFKALQPASLPDKMCCDTEILFITKQTLLDVATWNACHGVRVAAVSAASGYRPGGGFLSGGRHALEEAICMQSTLYISLARAVEKAKAMALCDRFDRPTHIPEYGCLLSPDVEILRHGTDRGYSLREFVTPLAAVLSVAMPNRNHLVTDSPVDLCCGQEYQRLLTEKFESVVFGAIQVQAEVLVVPDCGCGVFKNDPSQVGKVLGNVLKGKKGYFRKVMLVGSSTFAKAVIDAYHKDYVIGG